MMQFAAHGVVVEPAKIENSFLFDHALYPGIVVVLHAVAEASTSTLRTIARTAGATAELAAASAQIVGRSGTRPPDSEACSDVCVPHRSTGPARSST